mgnify:CR=1 FL=1
MKSGASESSYFFLEKYYKFPENVIVSHLPQELQQSNKSIKVLWAHHAYDQPHYLNFDFSICDLISSARVVIDSSVPPPSITVVFSLVMFTVLALPRY